MIAAEQLPPCKFCGGELDPVEAAGSDTCEGCWYGMRLDPEDFERRMRKRGVKLADGGHGFTQLDDGSIAHFNREPYRLASEPAPVNPTRAEFDELIARSKRKP